MDVSYTLSGSPVTRDRRSRSRVIGSAAAALGHLGTHGLLSQNTPGNEACAGGSHISWRILETPGSGHCPSHHVAVFCTWPSWSVPPAEAIYTLPVSTIPTPEGSFLLNPVRPQISWPHNAGLFLDMLCPQEPKVELRLQAPCR